MNVFFTIQIGFANPEVRRGHLRSEFLLLGDVDLSEYPEDVVGDLDVLVGVAQIGHVLTQCGYRNFQSFHLCFHFVQLRDVRRAGSLQSVDVARGDLGI